jgi:hypothetical protein
MLHKRGNKYKMKDGLICILTSFQLGKQYYAMLTTIADSNDFDDMDCDGNRYIDPIKVKDPYNLSDEEFRKIAGEGWEEYKHKVFI